MLLHKNPALPRFASRDLPPLSLAAKDLGRALQEGRSLFEVERFHQSEIGDDVITVCRLVNLRAAIYGTIMVHHGQDHYGINDNHSFLRKQSSAAVLIIWVANRNRRKFARSN